jgi:hypothetical protein
MKRLFFALTSAAALWATACSGGGSTVTPPPPTGNYKLSSLNGTYAFTTSGEVFTNGSTNSTSLARVGSFSADGMGHITGGVEDVNASGTVTSAIIINNTSSYTVNADGRGTLTLSVTSNGVPATLNFAIVLTSTSDGLLIDETSNSSQASTGSGNFIKQAGPFTVNSVANTYVFDFSGQNFSSQVSSIPISLVGEFTANGGVISTGFEDANVNFALSNGPISGNLTADATNINTFGRGTAVIGGEPFAFYIVDSTRVRFIDASTSSGNMLSGDAVLQTAAPTSLSGGFAFIVAGASGSGGVTRVGRLSVSGSGVTNVVMDTNDASNFHLTGGSGGGSVSNGSIAFDAANPGRGTLTFTDSSQSVPFSFVFYLSSASSGVIQETSQSQANGVVNVADGSIEAQGAGPFSSSNITGTYALNWSGLVVASGTVEDEEDLVAQATVSSLALSGTDDIFQFTSSTLTPQTDLALGGSIKIGGDGTSGDGNRTTMSVVYNRSSGATVDCVVYFVSPQLAFFANNKNTGTQRIIAGILKAQQ